MTVRLLAAFALLLPGAGVLAQTSQAESFHAFLQAANADARAEHPEATYTAAFADLNGDGRDEALVWQHAGLFCGSGGCGLYVYTPDGEGWRQLNDLTIIGEPVLLLPTRTRGWHDLGLMVRDGGMDLPYQARVRFDGRAYGLPVRAPRGRRLDGRVLIGQGAPSRRLFQ
jgi:hypothetical protein